MEIPQSLESRGVRPPENVVLVQNICKAKYLEKSYISDLKFSILWLDSLLLPKTQSWQIIEIPDHSWSSKISPIL